MKNIILYVTAMIIFACAGCGQVDDEYYERVPLTEDENSNYTPVNKTYWGNAADSATNSFIQTFWHQTAHRFVTHYAPPADRELQWNNYWPQAHAMDVVIDAYIRTNDEAYRAYYDLWFDGVRGGFSQNPRPGEEYKVDFIDDMSWIALTMIRLYETSNEDKFLTRAAQIFDDWIITGWTEIPCGGGLKWKISDGTGNGKNACTNCPATIVAARLHNFYKAKGEDEKANRYLASAFKLYDWFRSLFYDSSSKILFGGVDVNNGVEQRSNISLSYEVGTALGAAHELYKITGKSSYLQDAVDMATKATTDGMPMDVSTGCLRSEGPGDSDGGLFKGIFIRYFVKLINDTDVDKDKRKQFYQFMVHNANTLWTTAIHKDGDYACFPGTKWSEAIPQAGAVGLQAVVSGCTLLEGINAMNPIE